MTEDMFTALCRKGEGTQLEYKTCTEQLSDALYETVCSFLNHNGGHILLGVADDGSILGVNPEKAEQLKANIINSTKNRELFLPCPYIVPQSLFVDGKAVIVLDIPCGQYVYRYKGRYWDRNGEADIDITDHSELLLSLFERKNPHLFEERIVQGLAMEHIDSSTIQFCRNILATVKPGHPWLQMADEEVLLHTRLARRDAQTGDLQLKYAALVLFGTDDALADFMPRYRFEAMFHMCTYAEYNDLTRFPSRYDDRRTLRSNLIRVYSQLEQFVERYLPDKFYLPSGTTHRQDLRWLLFREIIANLCVHTDFSSGYACFFHVFKDRVVTKNPTRLLPETPEGDISLQQLGNYTKNPLLVRVFHELTWAEDMGSGTRNILRYAPIYFPQYKIEISSGQQFLFSITYMDENVTKNGSERGHVINELGNVTKNVTQNVTKNGSQNEVLAVKANENGSQNDLTDDELSLEFDLDANNRKAKQKKFRRQQGIMAIVKNNPKITVEEIALKLQAGVRTISSDLEELRTIVEYVGPSKGGHWQLKQKPGKE